MISGGHRRGILEVQQHAAGFGLVDQGGGGQFQDHGETQGGGGRRGLFRAVDRPPGGHRHPQGLDEGEGQGQGQKFVPGLRPARPEIFAAPGKGELAARTSGAPREA